MKDVLSSSLDKHTLLVTWNLKFSGCSEFCHVAAQRAGPVPRSPLLPALFPAQFRSGEGLARIPGVNPPLISKRHPHPLQLAIPRLSGPVGLHTGNICLRMRDPVMKHTHSLKVGLGLFGQEIPRCRVPGVWCGRGSCLLDSEHSALWDGAQPEEAQSGSTRPRTGAPLAQI